jgi:predicted MFS family arabinose efflux permease
MTCGQLTASPELPLSDSNAARAASAARDALPAREVVLLVTLAGVQFTNILDFMILMPLAPALMRLFEIDPRHFGLLVSAYTFAAAVSGFVAAFWIDRFGRKRAVLTMYAGFIVATLLCGLAPSYELLLAARIVAGMFGGVIGALVFTIIADVVPYARRARATSFLSAAFSLAAVMGVPTGLWFAAHYSWRAPFLALAVLATVAWITAMRVVPPLDAHLDAKSRRSPIAQLRAVFGVPNHLRAFAFTIALMTSVFMVVPFIAAYNVANVGVLEAELPYIYFAGGLATLFTAPLIGMLADRYGKKRLFTILAFVSLAPILLMTHLPPVPLAAAVAVSVVFFMFVPGRFGPAMALVTGSVAPRLRGSFLSFNGAVQQLGAGMASFASGLIVGTNQAGALTGFEWAGWWSVAATLVAVALALTIRVVPDGSGGPE